MGLLSNRRGRRRINLTEWEPASDVEIVSREERIFTDDQTGWSARCISFTHPDYPDAEILAAVYTVAATEDNEMDGEVGVRIAAELVVDDDPDDPWSVLIADDPWPESGGLPDADQEAVMIAAELAGGHTSYLPELPWGTPLARWDGRPFDIPDED
jgi:hypothetical protein